MKTRRTEYAGTVVSLVSVLLTLCAALAGPVGASCIGSDDPGISRLQNLAADDPKAAVQAVSGRLAGDNPPAVRAALYAVQAEAYEALDLNDAALQAATQGLRLAPAATDPMHVLLQRVAAESIFDTAGIEASIKAINTARAVQAHGSLADTCLLISLANLQHLADRDDLAITNATLAYHASTVTNAAEPHAEATDVLSMIMRGMGGLSAGVVAQPAVH